MGEHTARLARTWVRLTLGLATGVALVLVISGPGSTAFQLAAVAAVLIDLLAVRALCREWAWQARGCWWRFW